MNHPIKNDLRLIEAGFPCHQVGRKPIGNGEPAALCRPISLRVVLNVTKY